MKYLEEFLKNDEQPTRTKNSTTSERCQYTILGGDSKRELSGVGNVGTGGKQFESLKNSKNSLKKRTSLPYEQWRDVKRPLNNTPNSYLPIDMGQNLSIIVPEKTPKAVPTEPTLGNGHDEGNLNWWLDQLRSCQTRDEVFSLVSRFRTLSWTDEQRAVMSRAYVPFLTHLGGD
jgi:hypothetical protein